MLRPAHTVNETQRDIAKKSTYSSTKLVGRNRFAIADYIDTLGVPTNHDEVNRRAFSKEKN